jgi:general secretion pathway protein F
MRFDARVLGNDHRIGHVSVEAIDLAAAKRQLEAQSLRALDVRPSLVGRATTRRFRFPVVLFTQELLALLFKRGR